MTFRIRLITPKSREIIEIPDTWTLGTLKLEAGKRCKPKIRATKNIALLTGYPPTPLLLDQYPDTQLVQDCDDCLQPNDTIVVRVLDSRGSSKKGAKEQKEAAVENNYGDTGNPSSSANTKKAPAINKRPAIISTSNRSGSRKMARTGGAGRTLSGKVVISSAPPQQPQRITRRSAAFQMSSEHDVASQLLSSLNTNTGGGGTNNKVGRFLRGAMRGAVGKSYEASRAQTRVAAVIGGKFEFVPHPNTTGAAAVAGSGAHDSAAAMMVQKMQVQYSKGLEGRGNYTEDVDVIPLDALRAVISSVYNCNDDTDDADDPTPSNNNSNSNTNGKNKNTHREDDPAANSGREMLRPVNMAQLSPRVFWSLSYHYNHDNNHDNNNNHDTITALQTILPNLDWRYLQTGRSKMLSEKARENLRQERVRKGEIPDDTNTATTGNKHAAAAESSSMNKEQYDAGASVVEAVEEAMMESHLKLIHSNGTNGSISVRDRMAKAALARVTAGAGGGGGKVRVTHYNDDDDDSKGKLTSTPVSAEQNWCIVTPDEADLEELMECISVVPRVVSLSNEDGNNDDSNDDNVIQQQQQHTQKTIAHHLLEKCQIHNWRELANANSASIASELTLSSTSLRLPPNTSIISIASIEQWIEEAQNRSIDEIMMEVLDHREDVVIALRDLAQCGTPKDLMLWEAIPGVLLDVLVTAEACSGVSASLSLLEEEDLRRYCVRARCVVEELGWLSWFVTGIS